jgi:integrase/recombinase XerD
LTTRLLIFNPLEGLVWISVFCRLQMGLLGGKKRATLSEDRQPDEIKQYNKVTIHQLYSQFMEIKRSEGISENRKADLLICKKYFTDFLKSKGYSELMEDITTSVVREWMIDMQERYVVYLRSVRGDKKQGLAPKTINTRLKNL